MTEGKMLRFAAVLLLCCQTFSTTLQGEGVPASGCLAITNTKVPQKNLLSYTIQYNPMFPMNAVRFLTTKGKVICSDPSSPWAIKSVKYLDAKNKELQSVSNNTARHSVTPVPKNMSNKNTASAQSCTAPIRTPPVENSQKIDIRGHTTQKTELPRTKSPEQDWRGSSKTTETFQLDGPTWEEKKETESLLTETASSTITNEPFINNGYFCLKGDKFKYLGS